MNLISYSRNYLHFEYLDIVNKLNIQFIMLAANLRHLILAKSSSDRNFGVSTEAPFVILGNILKF